MKAPRPPAGQLNIHHCQSNGAAFHERFGTLCPDASPHVSWLEKQLHTHQKMATQRSLKSLSGGSPTGNTQLLRGLESRTTSAESARSPGSPAVLTPSDDGRRGRSMQSPTVQRAASGVFNQRNEGNMKGNPEHDAFHDSRSSSRLSSSRSLPSLQVRLASQPALEGHSNIGGRQATGWAPRGRLETSTPNWLAARTGSSPATAKSENAGLGNVHWQADSRLRSGIDML